MVMPGAYKFLLSSLRFALALAVLMCIPATAHAKKTVGVIMTGDIGYYQDIHKAFTSALGGKADIEIVVQTPAPEPMAWTNSARKLVTLGAEVIVSYGAPATLTVMKETTTIPIIFAGVYDPEAMEITGKNATGASSKVSIENVVTMLSKMSEMKNLGVIFNKSEKDTILQVREVKALEGKMGFKLVLMDAVQSSAGNELGGVDAVLVTTSCKVICSVDNIVNAARKAKIPSAATIGGGEKSGIILTVTAKPEEQGAAIAGMVVKVLGGEKPANIPVKKPDKIEIIINMREANASGVKVPDDVLRSATEVIK